MPIHNISIKPIEKDIIADEISLKVKIQRERLSVESTIENKVLQTENNLEIEKNYLIIFNDLFINKILYLDETSNKYILLSENALYIENQSSLKFKKLDNTIEEIYCIHYFLVNDLLDSVQKNYNHTFERIEEHIGNNIFIIDDRDILSYEFCDELINYINNLDETFIEKWESRQNVNCKYINVENIQNKKDKDNFDGKLFDITGKVIQYLYNNYGLKSTGDSGYCLRKIFGPTRVHSDGISVTAVQDGKYIPIRKIRNLSLIMALNSDYDGGEFYFPIQDYKIKLKKGQIIAFPPYWTHRHMVNPPTNGTYRYTINTWLFE